MHQDIPNDLFEAELRGWLPLFGIFLEEERIDKALIESDKSLKKYALISGEALTPTSACIFTARKGSPGARLAQ